MRWLRWAQATQNRIATLEAAHDAHHKHAEVPTEGPVVALEDEKHEHQDE